MNATITVSYNGEDRVIELDGSELSCVEQRDRTLHYYLSNGSRDWIGERVESALIELVRKAH